METEVIEFGDYKLTISEATVLVGMRRVRLRVEGDKAGDTDSDMRILRMLVYPDLIAPVVEQSGFEVWPVPFEDFLNLPEEIAIKWEDAVYKLNPHWQLSSSEPEEKKQQTTSTDG